MSNLYIQRHGQSETNVSKVFTCLRLDPDLTDIGRRQISESAAFLAKKNIRRIVSSPAKRAVRSAEILSVQLKAPVETDPDLIEVDVGELEGKSETVPENIGMFMEFMRDWLVKGNDRRFSGGESLAEVRTRVERLREKYFTPEKDATLLLGHCALFAVMTGLGGEFEKIEDLFLPNAGIARFCGKSNKREPRGVFRVHIQ